MGWLDMLSDSPKDNLGVTGDPKTWGKWDIPEQNEYSSLPDFGNSTTFYPAEKVKKTKQNVPPPPPIVPWEKRSFGFKFLVITGFIFFMIILIFPGPIFLALIAGVLSFLP